MDTKLKFRVFLEEYRDIFGFDAELKRASDKTKPLDENPIQPFNSVRMLEHLADKPVGTSKKGFQEFSNLVQWGTNPGAVRVRLGSQYTVYLERLIHDLEGNKVWLTKKVYKINTDEYKQYVESVSDALHDEIGKIALQNIDGAQKKWQGLEDLALAIKEEINDYANDHFVFDRIRKVNDNNYIVVYHVKGGGVGALQNPRSQGRINQIISDVNFSETTGLIRVMNTSVQTGDEGVSWHIMPSFFEGMFAPTQDPKEIATAVATSMKWF